MTQKLPAGESLVTATDTYHFIRGNLINGDRLLIEIDGSVIYTNCAVSTARAISGASEPRGKLN